MYRKSSITSLEPLAYQVSKCQKFFILLSRFLYHLNRKIITIILERDSLVFQKMHGFANLRLLGKYFSAIRL